MKRIIVKAAGITLGVLAVVIAIGLVIVAALNIPIPLPGGSTKNVDNPRPQETLEARARAGGTSPQPRAVQELIIQQQETIGELREEFSKIQQEFSGVKRELNYTRGLVEAMKGNNSALLQTVQTVMDSKSADGSRQAPIVVMPDRGEAQAQQPDFGSEAFRVAVESVVAEALLSFYFPEETSPRDELDLLKRAFEKAVERLFIDPGRPLAQGETLQTLFARSTKLTELEQRVNQNNGELGLIAGALSKEKDGSYSQVAKAIDTVAAQKVANDVKTSLEELERRLYDKEEIEQTKTEIYAAIESVKEDVAASDRDIKNLGVALARCIWGREYPKKREEALGILYLMFGDNFRIEQIKKARGYAEKLELPYPPPRPVKTQAD